MKTDSIPPLSEFRHHIPVQIRFNDIDILGHLNNTVYFSFYDTGKAYYFKTVRGNLMQWKRVDTVIANVNCAYINSIVFGDEIECYTRCLEIGEKSFRLQQMLVRTSDMAVMSVCETVMVSFDPATGHSTPLNDDWRRLLTEYEGRDLTASNHLKTT